MTDARITCGKTSGKFSGYLDGAISGREMQAVQAHLDGCAECANEFAAWRAMQRMLAEASTSKVPENLGLKLRLAISHESTRCQGWWNGVSARWENLVRPMVLQAASGLVGAVLLVGGIAALEGVMPVSNPVLAHDQPLGAVTMPHYLYSAAREQALTTPGDASIVVEADVNAEGQVYGFEIVSGPVDEPAQAAIRSNLMTQVYEPAKMFGVPVRGRVLVTFAGVQVNG